ncbi:MAG: circadian clock KaiB family protein [Gimesia sp.]|nr:circadian clock KaiB family protein [Gimesia sp.]
MEKLSLRIYVSHVSDKVRTYEAELTKTLSELKINFEIEVIEVLEMPEKALRDDVNHTPVIIRDLPEPVKHLIGGLVSQADILLQLELDGPEKKISLL